MLSKVVYDCNKTLQMVKVFARRDAHLLPSLEFWQLEECPKLESFLEGCLPLILKTLSIFFCDKLIIAKSSLS